MNMELTNILKLIKLKIPGIKIGQELGSGVAATAFWCQHPNFGYCVLKITEADAYPDVDNAIKAKGKEIRGIAKIYDVVPFNKNYVLIFQEIVGTELPSNLTRILHAILNDCLSVNQKKLKVCFQDNNIPDKDMKLAIELLKDAKSGLSWLQTNEELVDSHEGNFGVVLRNGRYQLVFLDLGHLQENFVKENSLMNRMGYKKATSKLRRNSISSDVYVDSRHDPNVNHSKKVIKKIAKNLNKKPYSHDPPIMGLKK